MPHLNTAFFLPQIIWLALIFLLCYLVVCFLLLPTMRLGILRRKSIIMMHLNEANRILARVEAIEAKTEQIVINHRNELNNIRYNAMHRAKTIVNSKVAAVNAEIAAHIEEIDRSKDEKRQMLEKTIPNIIEEVSGQVWDFLANPHKTNTIM